ncbi:carbon-nitrogen hydrolase [Colletotrichum higginsianum]|nr:carbon-nitrogen hydrolase [Colletotrichum higginsianum]
MDTLTYWVTRLEPLIRAEKKEEIIIVFCNRTGIEDDAVYAGTSAVIGIQDGEVKVYGLLGRGERELLVIDTDNPPYGKLVYRPESEKPPTTSSELLQLGGFSSPVVSSGRFFDHFGPAPACFSSQKIIFCLGVFPKIVEEIASVRPDKAVASGPNAYWYSVGVKF